MSAIIYYMVHGGRQKSADVLLPHWERYGIPIVVITPKDSPIRQTKNVHLPWGDKGPDGDAMHARLIYMLESFLKIGTEYALIVEFDCMCLLDKITFRNGLHGTPQYRPYDQVLCFMAERYVTPPYMLDKASAYKMLEVANQYPDVREGGYADRLMAAWANLAGVPVLPFPEGSWSKADWNPETLEPGMAESLTNAIKSGCKWFHFIKTKAQFDFVNREAAVTNHQPKGNTWHEPK